MSQVLSINPVLRAVGVIGAVAALVTGVTFAALSSSATLTGNTLSTGTASLKIWDGTVFANTAPGFAVNNIVPGTPSAPRNFYLQNAGGVPLEVKAQISQPFSVAGITDYADVDVKITGFCGLTETYTMAQIIAGPVALPCDPLNAGNAGDSGDFTKPGSYSVSYDIDPSTTFGDQASVGAFNYTFTGTQPAAPVAPVPSGL